MQTTQQGCWQLTEVAYHHENALTLPTTFEGAVASWRLATDWLTRQPGWQMIEIIDSQKTALAYSTWRTPEGTLYGLWVKETETRVELLPSTLRGDKMWLVRSVPVEQREQPESIDLAHVNTDDLNTPVDGYVTDYREGADTVEGEVAQNG